MQTMQVLLSVGPGGAWLVVFLHCQPGILPFSLPHHDTSLTPSSGPAAGLEERAQVLSSEWVAVLQAAGPCSLVLQRSLLAALPARLLEGKRHKPGVHESALWDFTFAGTGVRLYRGNLVSAVLKRLQISLRLLQNIMCPGQLADDELLHALPLLVGSPQTLRCALEEPLLLRDSGSQLHKLPFH